MSHPRWPLQFLKMFCDPSLVDEIEGDMEEMYWKWLSKYGRAKARRLYVFHTLKFLRPFIFKKRSTYPSNSFDMVLNYFKIAWRNISRNTSFAFINVLGLTLGVACVVMIYTLVSYHTSFDTYHSKADRVYRVVTEIHRDEVSYRAGVPQPLGKAFANDFSFSEKVARMKAYWSVIVSLPDEKDVPKFKEPGTVAFAEPALFEILDIPLVIGSISETNGALITKKYARKYFGTEDALDKTVKVSFAGTSHDFKVTGIIEDTRPNTDIRYEVFLSYADLKHLVPWFVADDAWGSIHSDMYCYVLLKPGVSPADVDNAFPAFERKYFPKEDAEAYAFKLQPLTDIHSDPNYGGEFKKSNLWAFVLAGVFILAIASFNFINLAAAQILNRAKEVGVRKVLGCMKSHLFSQFIVETGLIAIVAVIAGYALARLTLPAINTLINTRLELSLTAHWELPVFIASTWLILVFISGTYPALMLTRFQPATVLKSKLTDGTRGGFTIRRTLIVTQFVIAQLLIVCMLVIGDQVRYSINSDMGFDKEAIVLLPIPMWDITRARTLGNRISEMPGVRNTTLCFESPAGNSNSFTGVSFDNTNKIEPWSINLKDADENYLATFGVQLVAGRNLLPSDTAREFLVNETVVKRLGLASPQEMIGKRINVDEGTFVGEIVGVVKDFYNLSFHENISPIVLTTNPERYRTLAVKLDLANSNEPIAAFNRLWTETYPDHVFSYEFLDDRIAAFYNHDKAMLNMVEGISVIAIIISCLGLYGLVSFMAVRKTKEIGVRKVLGAEVKHILWLFASEFVLLISVAFVIAAPLAWLVMDGWLEQFIYRIDLLPMNFVLALTGTLLVAAVTVSYHSLKSAVANPVNSLRAE
ncbi:MAG TPA: ABC transporter permease [Cyclobacteriaceae bacterium]|nr:ABC transporter permease [Cyclobacteriaceae bacterium]